LKINNTYSLLSSPLQDLKILPHPFNATEKRGKQGNNSSSDDNEPLSRYRAPETSPVQAKKPIAEAQFLAEYEARRDAKFAHGKTGKTSSGDLQPQKEKTGAAEIEPREETEKAALMAQLQAEKKKREVLLAEKKIAETKYNTLQNTLENERKDMLLMKSEINKLEAEKKELSETLEETKKKSAMQEAMHERVCSSLLITLIIREPITKKMLIVTEVLIALCQCYSAINSRASWC